MVLNTVKALLHPALLEQRCMWFQAILIPSSKGRMHAVSWSPPCAVLVAPGKVASRQQSRDAQLGAHLLQC